MAYRYNRSLLGMAMKECRPKGLEVKVPMDLGSFLESFSIGRCPHGNKEIQLDQILSTWRL
jgi:hypothetical protein